MLLSLLVSVLRFVGLSGLDLGTDPLPGTWPPKSMDIGGTSPSPGTWPPK